MVKINFSKKGMKAGSKKQQEPRLVGGIIGEMLQGWNRSTELCVDLKTILRSDPVMKTGKAYQGVLRRDTDAEIEDFRCHDPHFTFTEAVPWFSKRNPRVFVGEHISVTRRDDGTLRLNFRPLKTDGHFSVERYALAVYNEICMANLHGSLWPCRRRMSRAFQLFQFQFDFCEVVMFRNSSTINYNYLIINKLYIIYII